MHLFCHLLSPGIERGILHTDRFTTNSITIDFYEGQSCFKLLQAALNIGGNNIDLNKTIISSLQIIQIPVQKSWICRRFYL